MLAYYPAGLEPFLGQDFIFVSLFIPTFSMMSPTGNWHLKNKGMNGTETIPLLDVFQAR